MVVFPEKESTYFIQDIHHLGRLPKLIGLRKTVFLTLEE